MSNLQFKFDESKLVQALAYFSLRGVKDLTKLKAAKLLYHADKIHLNRYGRPITGDSYVCMEHGPVPSNSLNEMNYALESDPEIREEEPAILKVLKPTNDRYPAFVLDDPALFNADAFSDSDIEVLDEVIANHGWKDASKLRNESHEENSWKLADRFRSPGSSSPIPFEALFDPGNQKMMELAQEDQQDEDDFRAAIMDGIYATM
jgi:uncharacterized phage-associated protein